MTWEDKLAEIRNALEKMITTLNHDQDYDGATVCQEALQKIACINDHTEIHVSELEWKP